MKKIQLLAAASVLAFALPALAQPMSAEDFAAMAASSDLFEIQSSELAKEKGEADAVKEFARMMIEDHNNASPELQTAVSSAGVEVPTEMNAQHGSQLASLEGLEGAELDAAYVEAQVRP